MLPSIRIKIQWEIIHKLANIKMKTITTILLILVSLNLNAQEFVNDTTRLSVRNYFGSVL